VSAVKPLLMGCCGVRVGMIPTVGAGTAGERHRVEADPGRVRLP
jgi:hypothetical protein